jgi:ribosomal subunit interface protein
MRIQITQRQCEVPEPVLERARTRLAGFVRYDPRLSGAEVTFEAQRHQKRVDAVLTVDRREPVLGRGEGADFQQALDRMMDRLSRKLRRLRAQAVEHQGAQRDVEL